VASDGGPDDAAEWIFFDASTVESQDLPGFAMHLQPSPGGGMDATGSPGNPDALPAAATVLTAQAPAPAPTPVPALATPTAPAPLAATDGKRKKSGGRKRGGGHGGHGAGGSSGGGGASGGNSNSGSASGSGSRGVAVPLRSCLRPSAGPDAPLTARANGGTSRAGDRAARGLRFGSVSARVIGRGVGGCGVPSGGGWALALASPWRDAEDRCVIGWV
jgi:hypothetical protein